MNCLQATFCDDIRHEVNGKVSLIGCYNNNLFAGNFPIQLPKLCAHLRIFIDPITEPTEFIATIKNSENKEIIKVTSDLEPRERPQADENESEDEILVGLEMPGISFSSPTTLYVEVEIGPHFLSGPLLNIRQRAQDS